MSNECENYASPLPVKFPRTVRAYLHYQLICQINVIVIGAFCAFATGFNFPGASHDTVLQTEAKTRMTSPQDN